MIEDLERRVDEYFAASEPFPVTRPTLTSLRPGSYPYNLPVNINYIETGDDYNLPQDFSQPMRKEHAEIKT